MHGNSGEYNDSDPHKVHLTHLKKAIFLTIWVHVLGITERFKIIKVLLRESEHTGHVGWTAI